LKIKNILVSQPKPENEKNPYKGIADKYKLNIEFNKFFKIEGVPARDFRQTRINILDYTAIIFTSKNAVDQFFRLCKEMRITVPETMKYFCISESAAFYLQNYIQFRKRKIFHGNQDFSNLLVLINKHHDEKFLLPCAEEQHKQDIFKQLDENEIKYKKAVIYKNVNNDLSHLDIKKYDMLVFFSPSGIASLFNNFPKFKQGDTLIAAFGPTTHKAIKEAGLRLDVSAPNTNAPSMATAIDQFLQKLNKKK
jgi:uroporphyrinogen-III synthase